MGVACRKNIHILSAHFFCYVSEQNFVGGTLIIYVGYSSCTRKRYTHKFWAEKDSFKFSH